MALKNIDRADIVASLEVPQPAPGSLEEGACRLSNRDSTLLSPSVINGKTTEHTQYKMHRTAQILRCSMARERKSLSCTALLIGRLKLEEEKSWKRNSVTYSTLGWRTRLKMKFLSLYSC